MPLSRTPIPQSHPPVTSANNSADLLYFATTTAAATASMSAMDDLVDLMQNDDVHNSTARTQEQILHISDNVTVTSAGSTVHPHDVSGVVPLSERQDTTAVAVLQDVVSGLRTEIGALQAERQHLLRITSTILQPPGTQLSSSNFPRDATNMWMPRELFPVATVTSQAVNPLPTGQNTPQPHAPISATQASGQQLVMPAREPYAHPTVPPPTHSLPSHMNVQPTLSYSHMHPCNTNNVPAFMNIHSQTHPQAQPSAWYNTYTIPSGISNMNGSNSRRLYDISRLVKSWNISFPPRDRSSPIDAKKYLKLIEQRMVTNEISFDNFHAVVTNTLDGDVLEWYYQNEGLFHSWPSFKEYFKIWQIQQTDEAVLQGIYSAKQRNDEAGISFINRMQGAFAKLEDPLPQAKQIRIIISRFNNYFLQKFWNTREITKFAIRRKLKTFFFFYCHPI